MKPTVEDVLHYIREAEEEALRSPGELPLLMLGLPVEDEDRRERAEKFIDGAMR